MKRMLALLAAVFPFILWRRLKGSVPEYATWADYLADAEGDALPPALRPDPRLDDLEWERDCE